MKCYPSLEMSPSPWSFVMAVFQADLQDPDVATAESVQTMCAHIHRAARDPLVLKTAEQSELMWGVGRPAVKLAAARLHLTAQPGAGCFWWAKHWVKAVPHSQFKARVAAFPQKRQLLIAPAVVLRSLNPEGDCSTFSMLLAAMLEALGVRWELVTAAVEPSDPTLYSHVFVRAVLENGARMTLDGSHGQYPGWEVPRGHQFRRQVWGMDGEPIDDEAPPVSALGEYHPRRGLGDDSSDWSDTGAVAGSTPIDLGVLPGGTMTVNAPSDGVLTEGSYSSGAVIPSGYYSPDGGATIVALPTGAAVAPASGTSNAQWAAAIASMTKAGMTLAEINAIKPGTVVSANGAILRQSTGYAVPVGGVTASLGSGSTTMWALAALGVLAFLFVATKKS